MKVEASLAGLRILVVEDEMLVAMLVEDLLLSEGCEVVGPVASVAGALALVKKGGLDGAVLDVNLGSETVFPVADALAQADVPFVFVTGYGPSGLNDAHRDRVTIQKPFNIDNFVGELAQGLAESAPR